jgi:hypothetical protein
LARTFGEGAIMILRLAMIVLLAFLPLGQARASDRDYPAADGGLLIYSAGSIGPMNFAFRYKRVRTAAGAAVSDWSGTIGCGCVGLIRAQAGGMDYRGRETGRVSIRALPAGDYEIYDFGFSGSMGMAVVSSSSRTRFAIPFTIRPGEATYIGNFARAPSLGTPLQPTLGAAGYFLISNQAERDLAIARQRRPDLPAIRISVTDVSALGHPALRSTEPE